MKKNINLSYTRWLLIFIHCTKVFVVLKSFNREYNYLNFSKAIMENLKLTYYLVDLKIKNKAPVEIYFMSRVFQVHSHCYDKRKKKGKSEIRKMYLFLLPPPSLSEGFGCWNSHPYPPPPPPTHTHTHTHLTLFTDFFFSLIHGYLNKGWVSWPNDNPSRKSEKGGCYKPDLLLRERVKEAK